MPTLEEAIIGRLLSSARVSELVEARIYPERAPEKDPLPRITVSDASSEEETNSLSTAGETALIHALVEVNCWAATRPAAKDLAARVRDRLHRYAGPAGGLYLQQSLLLTRLSQYEPDPHGGDRGVHRRILEFSVWYEEPAPTGE